MKLFAIAVLGTLLLLTPAFAQNTAATYRSDHAGKRYDFTVTHAQIDAAPSWAETQANPPLSPRMALAHARADLATFLPDASRWVHPKITLTGVAGPNKWIYIIEFQGPLPPHSIDGPVDIMRIPVLMDGTAIKPIVTPANA